MKVTFVALNYAPSVGGAQTLIAELATGFVARGCEVEVLTTDSLRLPSARNSGNVPVAEEVIDGVTVRRFGTPRAVPSSLRAVRRATKAMQRRSGRPSRAPSPWLLGPWSPALLRSVRKAMRSSDIVVGVAAPYVTALAPTWWCRGARARVVVVPLLHVSSSSPHPAVARTLRRADRVVALTDFEAAVCIESGADAARVAVVPAGTNPDDYPAMPAADARRILDLPERSTVGFVGRLAAYKGIDTLLEAARELWIDHPDATVLIAGSPSGWTGHRDPAIRALGGDRLIVREEFDDDHRALLLAACDVVVHPSREESFGMVALEAWAARRPIVVADIPAVRGVVEPGVTGEIIEPGDSTGLARTLAELLDDPGRRARLGAAGRAEVEDRYSWDRICDSWQTHLADTLAGER